MNKLATIKLALAAGAALAVAPMTTLQADEYSGPAAMMQLTLPLDAGSQSLPHLNLQILQSSKTFLNPDARVSLLPPLVDIELNRNGLSHLRGSGVNLLPSAYKLNADGGIGFAGGIMLGAAAAAGYFIYDAMDGQSDDDSDAVQTTQD